MHDPLMRVEDVMQAQVVTAAPDDTLKRAAGLLTSRRISGLPVCDEDGRVVGVLSEQDILWKEVCVPENEGRFQRALSRAYGYHQRCRAMTARDAMSVPAIVIAPNESLVAAARLMILRRVNRLPVVEEGRLVGIVTRADLVRAFTRSDEEIEHEITEDVLETMLWVDRNSISLVVHDGDVSLSGKVENRTVAELVEGHIRRVPGVVRVQSQLTWELDDLTRRVARSADQLPRRT
jgi:CBS domain-containing protein